MKPNPNTGEFILRSGTVISPQLTHSEFLSSVEGSISKVNVKNEPYCSYRFEDNEDSLVMIAYFKGEKLESIHISLLNPEFGTNWSDWSEEKQLNLKQANDSWLMKNDLTPDKQYSWGSVNSAYDQKSGSSHIVIKYNI